MNYYQRLNPDDLKKLEPDFISFLVLNGITGNDWLKMRNQNPEKADSMIDQFSEVVFEASLRKAEYLLMVDEKTVRSFHCRSNDIVLASLSYDGENQAFNFHDVNDLKTELENNKSLHIVSITKSYSKKREHEMFDMIQSGCKIANEDVFNLLILFWAELNAQKN